MSWITGKIRLFRSPWLVCLLFLWTGVAWSAGTEGTDTQVKAAFVFNFMRYVDWPEGTPGPAEPLVVCQARSASATLAAIEGRQVKGRELRLRQVDNDPAGCHVLVFGEGDTGSTLFRRAQGRPILTVGEGWGFLDDGGVIALALVDGKMAFGANLEAARRSSLRLGSQMLKLARRIVDAAAR